MSSIDEEEFAPVVLFPKGFSKVWDGLDLRKKLSQKAIYYFDGMQKRISKPCLSEQTPELDDEEIENIDNIDIPDNLTDLKNLDNEEQQNVDVEKVWAEYDIDERHSNKGANPITQNHKVQNQEEIKKEQHHESVETPSRKGLLYESDELKHAETHEHSKDLLKVKVDNVAKVKNCLNRKDVVVKSILRSMRKFYSELLQDNSEYKRKIRNIKLKHQKLIRCSLELAKTLSLGNSDEAVAFYLTAVAFPTDLKKILAKGISEEPENKGLFNEGIREIERIECALTRYSKRVMDEFIKIPEVCMLLLNYLDKVENEEYDDHYKMLKEMANESLETNKESEMHDKAIAIVTSLTNINN